jgi:Gas vesicle synthesis protein GvpO
MAQRTSKRSADDRDTDQLPPMSAREAADVASEYITDMAKLEPVGMTSVEPTDDDGWLVEFEVLEEHRIPSSSDILALYEVEIDPDGELIAFRRTTRFLRGQTNKQPNGRSKGGEPT